MDYGQFDRSKLTDRGRKVLRLAENAALKDFGTHITTGHLLLGLYTEGSGIAAKVLYQCVIDRQRLEVAISNATPRAEEAVRTLEVAPETKLAMERAAFRAQELGHNYIGTEHILLGILATPPNVALAAIKAINKCRIPDIIDTTLGYISPMEEARVSSGDVMPIIPQAVLDNAKQHNLKTDMYLSDAQSVRRVQEFMDYAYRKGFIDCMSTFAWWRNGEQFVGVTGVPLEESVAHVQQIYGFSPLKLKQDTEDKCRWYIG